MIRRPPRSTQSRSSAASDVYKRQLQLHPRAALRADYEAPRFPVTRDKDSVCREVILYSPAYRVWAGKYLCLFALYRRKASYALELFRYLAYVYPRAEAERYQAARGLRLGRAASGPAEGREDLADPILIRIDCDV